MTEPRPEEQTTPEDFETIDPSAINGEKSSDIVRDEAQITEITETPETEMNAPASDVSQTSAATETFSDSTAAIADPTPSQGDLNRDRHSTLPTNPPEVEENEMDLTLPSTPDR
ncbi:MAG: hypothetical protein EAZ61_08215 [Oscillatoriales cyanobacterium]|nr:MAG: hypothetical protein EAZ61_08215 [Oscillatoriales cyanobacterium]